jgi:hypothetical protein
VVDRTTPAEASPLDPVADEWAKRTAKALDMVDRGIDATRPLGMEPDEYRARMTAVKLVLGVQRSALPLPTQKALGLGELEVKDGTRVLRLRWADGRLVNLPLHDPHAGRDAQDDENDES